MGGIQNFQQALTYTCTGACFLLSLKQNLCHSIYMLLILKQLVPEERLFHGMGAWWSCVFTNHTFTCKHNCTYYIKICILLPVEGF